MPQGLPALQFTSNTIYYLFFSCHSPWWILSSSFSFQQSTRSTSPAGPQSPLDKTSCGGPIATALSCHAPLPVWLTQSKPCRLHGIVEFRSWDGTGEGLGLIKTHALGLVKNQDFILFINILFENLGCGGKSFWQFYKVLLDNEPPHSVFV